mmetsp:Transcript_23395/g.58064  ORF Transcript_23395/g.58064 Transcript_23395/m.58064 type:complete len:84 (-) Transcript_23395:77-328(-)
MSSFISGRASRPPSLISMRHRTLQSLFFRNTRTIHPSSEKAHFMAEENSSSPLSPRIQRALTFRGGSRFKSYDFEEQMYRFHK